ncbi:MAG: hypothetical protein ACRDTM_06670 [Micromonosporaceae bacterium]
MSDTAHLFQEWVPKAHDVRLTVMDDRYFAVRIDTTAEVAEVDWRVDYDALHHTPVGVPEPIRDAVRALMRQLDLRFAALDFVVTPTGQWTFLEFSDRLPGCS